MYPDAKAPKNRNIIRLAVGPKKWDLLCHQDNEVCPIFEKENIGKWTYLIILTCFSLVCFRKRKRDFYRSWIKRDKYCMYIDNNVVSTTDYHVANINGILGH